MKIYLLIIIAFSISFISACEAAHQPPTQSQIMDEKINQLKKPLTVISTGKTTIACSASLIDTEGTVITVWGDNFCSMEKGDIIGAVK